MTNAESADLSAKHALLEAAQRLFAANGFEKVSMRVLTQEAGVNLAAVNYHFGSKEGLIEAVVESYINPVNELRLQRLTDAEAEGTPGVETILDCFLRPVLESVRSSALSEKLFFQMMGRCMNDRGLGNLPATSIALFEKVTTRYPVALQRICPQLKLEEILWRLHFTVGALIHVLIHTEGLRIVSRGKIGNPSVEGILTMVKSYCSAGIQAPPNEL